MQIIEQHVVFDAAQAVASERCSAFTSLLRQADGSLLCSFKTGPRKLSPDDRLILMKSTDDGRTWARQYDGFDTTHDGTPGSLMAGHLCERVPGQLMISMAWVDRTDPTRPLSNPETSGVLPMRYLLAESTDGGASWAPPRRVSLAPHPGANPTDRIVRLTNGQLLLPYESWKEWDDVEGEQSANVKLSVDEGRTWGDPITMASHPEGRLYYWDNHVTVLRDSGRLLAAFWTHDAKAGRDTTIHLAWGEPDGKRWSTPHATPVAGQVTEPVHLGGERLMLVYVHRHDPPSIRAVLSDDLGRTWRLDEELIVYASGGRRQAGMGEARSDAEYWDDMTRWTFGHPKATVLPDGRVVVVYYAPPADAPADADPVPTSVHCALLDVGG